jgi:hypothetical protein
MSVFAKVERIEDEAALSNEKSNGLTLYRLKRVKACKHRASDSMMYSVKCLHPDRIEGRHCVNLNCPLLYDMEV